MCRCDRLGEALAHRPHAERLLEGPPLALVCSSPSVVSIITPSEARTRFGSAQTVKSSRRLSSSRASACEVTSQPPSAGTHEIGSAVAQAVERADAAVELEIGELDRGADREARLPRGVLGLVDVDLRDERAPSRPMLSGARRRGR